MTQPPPTAPEPEELDPFDEQVAALRAVGKTLEETAAALGVSVSTVQRVLRKPAVLARVRRIQLEAVGAVTAALLAGGREAAETLLELGRTGTKEDVVRLRAVLGTLQNLNQYAAVTNLEALVLDQQARLERRDAKPGEGPSDPAPQPGAGDGPGGAGGPGGPDPDPAAGGPDAADDGGGPGA